MKHALRFLIGVLLTLQYSCNNDNTNSKTVSTEKIKIENQGVNIDYDDSKIGDTTILFIHGWGIDKTYWTDQVGFFAKRYRVITVDLPGFGKSGKNRNSWTVEDYGKDISAVLTKLDLKNVILVGHSMSGAIIVEAALTNPSRVIGIVGIDNFKNFGAVETPQSKKEAADFFKAARAHYKETVSEYINQALFSPSTDSLIRRKVLNDITNADSVIALNVLEQAGNYPFDDKLKSFKKTLFLINSDVIPTDTLTFQKNKIDYYLLNIGSTGHYPMLEKPQDLNLLLQQAIDKMKSK